MAQTIKIELTDDLTGGPATETVNFALDGRSYEIDLNEANAKALRAALAKYVEKGRKAGRQPRAAGGTVTAFSQLNETEKAKFRVWAKMPDAKRIADHRVEEWIKAGKP